MKGILHKIFIQNNFELLKDVEEFDFYQKIKQEYYFTVSYKEEELEEFFTSKKTEKIIEIQDLLSERNEDISKNTSLIIYVKTSNYEEFFENNKKNIYKIEEDEFYFRKYVIVYTENSIEKITNIENVMEKINEVLLELNRMDNFEEEYFKDEEFFLVMELYIKLSFLSYETNNKEFSSLSKKILDEVEFLGISHQYSSIINWMQKKDLILSNEEDDYYSKLSKEFLDIENEGEILLDFLNKLEELKQ